MGRVVPENGVRVSSACSRRDPAGEFDITTRAIRFYEEKGYLSPSRNGTRRIYSSTDRAALRLILRGKRLGLSQDETAEMIRMYGSLGGNRKQLEKFILQISEKRAEPKRKQRDLEVLLNDLQGVEDRRCSTSANRTKMPEPKMACHAADFPAVYLTFVSPGAKIL